MLLFEVGSRHLELAAGQKLSFKRKNNLLAFGDVELSRSATFSVPASAHNNEVFGIANDARLYGDFARQRWAATLVTDSVSINGFIYITSCDKSTYSCSFVFGEMLNWKEIKEAGVLGDYLFFTENVEWRRENIVPANTHYNDFYGIINYNDMLDYERYGTCILPSVQVYELLSRACNYFGVTLQIDASIESALQRMRIVQPKVEGGMARFRNALKKSDITTIDASGLSGGILGTSADIMEVLRIAEGNIRVVISTSYATFYATRDCSITFPEDFPSGIFMASVVSNSATFYGGYGFTLDNAMSVYGDPLAGRTVDLAQNQAFTFISKQNYSYMQVTSKTVVNGFSADASPFDYSVIVGVEIEDTTYGSYSYLQLNLPQITLLDLVKIACHTLGGFFEYDADTSTLTIADFQFLDAIPLRNIVKESNLERKFINFAQKNTITFDYDDSVTRHREIAYLIDNQNLDAEKVIYTVPLSEGAGEYMRDMQVNGEGVVEFINERGTLMRAGSSAYLGAIDLVSNAKIEQLCDMSTSVKVQVVMPMYVFAKLNEAQKLLYKGVEWVWTEVQWSDGVATLQLSKI